MLPPFILNFTNTNSYLFEPIYTSVCSACCLTSDWKSSFKFLKSHPATHTPSCMKSSPKILISHRGSQLSASVCFPVPKNESEVCVILMVVQCHTVAEFWSRVQKHGNYGRNFIYQTRSVRHPKERRSRRTKGTQWNNNPRLCHRWTAVVDWKIFNKLKYRLRHMLSTCIGLFTSLITHLKS